MVFFQRKPYPTGNYSLEFIFEDIRRRLKDSVDARLAESRYYSRGLWRRLFNVATARLRQGDVNFVTGDITYVSLGLPGKTTLVVIPDCGPMHDETGLSRLLQKWLWIRLPALHAARVITISEFSRQEIVHFAGCSPDKVVVIPVAISGEFSYAPRPFRREKPVLLQVGQAENKNLARIIEAIRGLDVRLVTIGTLGDRARQALDVAGIDYVNHQRLSNDDVVKAYVDSDMLIFPSTYEGFGMPILEAQAVGRPVVTANVASMPWVAGDAACLVDPSSVASIRAGILKVISDVEYRESLVTKGLENVKRFPAERIAAMYLDQILAVHVS